MESLGNDDVSPMNCRKYEMVRDDVNQKMPEDIKGVFLSVNPKTDFRSKNGFRVPFGKSKSGFLTW